MADIVVVADGETTYSTALSWRDAELDGATTTLADLRPAGDDPLAWAEYKEPAPAQNPIKIELKLVPPANAPLYCMVGIARFNGSGAPSWEWQPPLSAPLGSAQFTKTYALDRALHVNSNGEVLYCIVALALPRALRLPGQPYHSPSGVAISSSKVIN